MFSQAHFNALTNATRHHEYFQGLSRLLPVPGVLVSFLELSFLSKMAILALGGRRQPLKKPSESQKGHFYEKMNALIDTKTPELSKTAKETGLSVAFVEAWIKSKFANAKAGPKNHLHKNKGWLTQRCRLARVCGIGRRISVE